MKLPNELHSQATPRPRKSSVEQQGENAHCAAWIYTAEDCVMYDENDEPQYPAHMDQELSERIFNDVGNIDHIYTVIQECVDEVTEEQFMKFNRS